MLLKCARCTGPFERLSHAEAVGVLHKLGATQGDEDGGLSTEQEKYDGAVGAWEPSAHVTK